jgi:hypothetical protein
VGAIQQGGLYQGLLPTLMGIIPYSGTAWCVKQTLLEELFPSTSPHKPTVAQSLGINAAAGYENCSSVFLCSVIFIFSQIVWPVRHLSAGHRQTAHADCPSSGWQTIDEFQV